MSPAEREALILSLAPLVTILTRVFARKITGVAPDDLRQAGYVAAIRAVDTYDPARGVPLSAYAKQVIAGAILNEARRWDYVSERDRRTLRDAERFVLAFGQEHGRRPTSNEIAENVPKYEHARQAVYEYVPLSIDAAVAINVPEGREGPPLAIVGKLAAPESVEGEVEAAADKMLIAAAIAQLDPRERAIVAAHYFDRKPLREIHREMGLSPQRVSQLHLRALAKLRAVVSTTRAVA